MTSRLGGRAAMTERNNALTDSADLKTVATSGSSTMAIVPLPMLLRNSVRFGLFIVEAVFSTHLLGHDWGFLTS